MAKVLVDTRNMERDEWLDWRKKGIGASEAASILWLSKWATPMTVFLDKIDAIEPEEQSNFQEWGLALEDVIAKHFKKETDSEGYDYRVQRRNAILMHDQHDFMLANLDRTVYSKEEGWGVLELKTASEYKDKEWDEDEQKAPENYVIQVQHQLAVAGPNYTYGWLAALVGGNKFYKVRIPRDEVIIEALIEIEREFWQLVINKTPPEMDASAATKKALGLVYGKAIEGAELDVSEQAADVAEWIRKYKKAGEAKKKIEAVQDLAGNRLKALLKENDFATIEGVPAYKWSRWEETRVDSKLLKSDFPEVFEKVTKTGQKGRLSFLGGYK